MFPEEGTCKKLLRGEKLLNFGKLFQKSTNLKKNLSKVEKLYKNQEFFVLA